MAWPAEVLVPQLRVSGLTGLCHGSWIRFANMFGATELIGSDLKEKIDRTASLQTGCVIITGRLLDYKLPAAVKHEKQLR